MRTPLLHDNQVRETMSEGEVDDDDDSDDEAAIHEAARLTVYAPQIALETLTASCARGVLLLTYFLFGLCLFLTIESVVRGNTYVVFDELICGANADGDAGLSVDIGPHGTLINSSSRCVVVPSSTAGYAVNWSGNISGVQDLIGTISLLARVGGREGDVNATSLPVPPLVSFDVHVWGCTLADPKACFLDMKQWQLVLSIWDQTRSLLLVPSPSLLEHEQLELPIFTGIYQNQEVLRTFGGLSGYRMEVGLSSDSIDLSTCPLSFVFNYQHVFPLKAFRVLETIMILINAVVLVLWCTWLYYPSSRAITPAAAILERHWLTLFLIALILYQDPIYCFGQWAPPQSMGVGAKFTSQVCVAVGQSLLLFVWLLFVDGFRHRELSSLLHPSCLAPKILIGILFLVGCVGMAALSFPTLFLASSSSSLLAVNNWSAARTSAFLLYALLLLVALLLWLSYVIYLMVKSGMALRKMNYLQTRYLQLSYRFFVLQAVLVATAYGVVSVVTISRDVGAQRALDDKSFINYTNAVLVPLTQPFGKLVFIFIYGFILLFLHLPATQSATTSNIVTYYVNWEDDYRRLQAQWTARRLKKGRTRRGMPPLMLLEVLLKRPLREVKRRLLPHQDMLPPIFCCETAHKLLELANQAYYDVPGKPTPGGWGDMNMVPGYRLVDTVCDEGFDTFAMVVVHETEGRVVVAFRGSSSKKQWLNNLRFQHCELDFSKLPEIDHDDEEEEEAEEESSRNDMRLQQMKKGLSGSGGEAASPVSSRAASRQPRGRGVDGDHGDEGGDKGDDEAAAAAARVNPVLHPGRLTEAVATGADLIQQTGDLISEGVLTTAQLLRVDRLPGIRRLLRGHVHLGFWESYIPVRRRLAQVVYRTMIRRPGSKLWLTGHSLGGALATFAALDLTINVLPKLDLALESQRALDHNSPSAPEAGGSAPIRTGELALYTFGAPRVMNHALAARFNKAVPHCFRVITDGDMVSGVPPPWFYKHVGKEVVIDGEGSGSLVIDPSFMERRLRTRRSKLKLHVLASYQKALSGVLEAARTVQPPPHHPTIQLAFEDVDEGDAGTQKS